MHVCGYLFLAATVQFTNQRITPLYIHGSNWSLSTWLLTEVPEANHLKLWLCVIWSLGMIQPVSLIVFWSWMLRGANRAPLMFLIFERGSGRAKPWITSSLTSSWRRAGFDDAPLWLPKASASSTSCNLVDSSNLLRGHSDPFSRSFLKRFQLGWHDSNGLRVDGFLNLDPYPKGESCYAFSACSKLLLNFLMTK